MANQIPIECAELLDRQRGVLARWQAPACDLNPAMIDRLLRTDRWRPLYRGVYCAHTGNLSREAVIWAAVLRCGPDAALSHQTAAGLDRLVTDRGGPVHVTVGSQKRLSFLPGEFAAGLPRIIVHHSLRLADIRHPAQLPPRIRIVETVLDLADQAKDADEMYGWLSMACSRGLVTPAQLRAAALRRPKLHRRAEIMEALEEISAGAMSSLERRHYRDVERAHGLPTAQRQVKTRPGERSAYLDNFYAAFLLIVELDGLQWHPVEERWHDIHRDNRFARDGILTLRYNWADIAVRPCEVAAEMAQVMHQRGWTGTLSACGPACKAVSP